MYFSETITVRPQNDEGDYAKNIVLCQVQPPRSPWKKPPSMHKVDSCQCRLDGAHFFELVREIPHCHDTADNTSGFRPNHACEAITASGQFELRRAFTA